MALVFAYELNPHNYSAGLLLASLWQVRQPRLSDDIYTHLLNDDPNQSDFITETWYRALLARGDFAKIEQLLPSFLTHDSLHTPAWLDAMFFAAHRTGDSKPLQQLLDKSSPLGPSLRRLVEIELMAQTGHLNQAHEALKNLKIDTFYAAYYQINELISLGFPDEALLALNRASSILNESDSKHLILLRMDAFAVKGWISLVHNEAHLVLTVPTNSSMVELLCTHLIRHPDKELLTALFEKLQQEPLPLNADTYQATLALFFTAGANADWQNLHIARNMLGQLGISSRDTLNLAESFFHGQSAQKHLGSILPIFQPLPFKIAYTATNNKSTSPVVLQPLALAVTYALFEHYGGNQPVARAP